MLPPLVRAPGTKRRWVRRTSDPRFLNMIPPQAQPGLTLAQARCVEAFGRNRGWVMWRKKQTDGTYTVGRQS
jgi:hypothetical protein